MQINVYSRGSTEFRADTVYQEPDIRSAISAASAGEPPATVADVITDLTDTERSNISDDEYAVVTEDDGTELWRGWLSGDRNAPAPDQEPEGETPGYWQVRAALSSALNSLALVSCSDKPGLAPRGGFAELAEMARDALADIDKLMAGSEPHPAEAKLAVIRAFIETKAAKFSAEFFRVRPEDIKVQGADILAIINGQQGATDLEDDFTQDRHADLDAGEGGGAMTDADFYDRTAGVPDTWGDRDDADRRANGEHDGDAGDDL